MPPGSYTLDARAIGFATFSKTGIVIAPGQARQLNVSLAIAVQQQDITVTDQNSGVSINPDENSSALVVKGSDLDALSDDPDELQNELQALAGPAAGPSGGQIYIDGFTGGQIPPKSSIREIRVNQNPFSAEFDKIGYGRIEILTKPGSDAFPGHITSLGNDSAWNTANPLVKEQPSYYLYFIQADVNGPLIRNASYFFSLFHFDRQNQTIIDAVNPEDPTTNFNQALPNPSSLLVPNPRVDFQLGKNNTLSIRDSYFRSVATANGPGQLNLPEQAYNVNDQENAVQASDTVVVNPRVINETHFQWRDESAIARSPPTSLPRLRCKEHSPTAEATPGLRKITRTFSNCKIIPLQRPAATPYGSGPVCAPIEMPTIRQPDRTEIIYLLRLISIRRRHPHNIRPP